MIKVFFDASVIFSAINSKTGGSYYLLSLSKSRKIVAITSQTVVKEVENNLNKFKNLDKHRLHKAVVDFNLLVREKIKQEEISVFFKKVEKKDAHVLAGAISTNCDYLVTLDRKHLNNQKTKDSFSQLKILSPKELILQILL
jgi:putative PIN family toxin of toxin-antitoxin system